MSTANMPTDSNRYVEFDAYVEFQLDKTRKSIRTNDLLTAFAAVVVIVLTGALAFVVLDHWVIPGGFSVTARWLWSIGLFGLTCGWLIWSIGLPSFRTVNRLFAAKELEHADPALRSNLLNWVDLHDAGRIVNPAVMKTIEKQAATQLSKMDVGQAVDHRRLLQTAYALLAIVVLFCGYALISPKKISTALWRMLPFTSAGAVTRTEILEVQPGDVTLLSRGRLEVGAILAGELPETVQLLYSTADGRIQDEAVVLRPEAEGLARYRGVFAGETGQGVLQDFTYRIIAGDAESRRFTVTVRQPPSATVQEVAYQFPEYMKLDESTSPGGHIEGWEGAIATITATADKPCKSAVLQFLNDPQSPPTGDDVSVQVTDGMNLRAVWTLAFRNDGTFPKHYRIQCRSEEGEADPAPVVYNIAVKLDRPPEVVLLHPERDLTAPANGVIPLLVQASDPDFELRYVNLQADKAGQPIHRHQLSEGRQAKVTLEHDFKLADLNLEPGDEFEFWIEAFDNRQPRYNRKNTPRIKVRIAEPATPEEAQQQLADQKRERDERLAEANREQNSERSDAEPMPRDGAESDSTDTDPKERDPQDRAEKPQENQSQDDAATQSGNTGDKSGDQKKDGSEKNPGEGADGGKSAAKDGTQESPLSPDGENDDELLEKLADRFKPQPNQPQDSAKPDRGEKSKDRTQTKPKNANADPQSDDGKPSDPNDDAADGSKKPTGDETPEKKGDKQPSAAKTPKGQSDEKPENSGSNTEPMPDKAEPTGGSEGEPQPKPRNEPGPKSKSQPGGKAKDSAAGEEPMPGDEKSKSNDDDESKPAADDGDRPRQPKQSTAKDDAGTKPGQGANSKPKPDETSPSDDADPVNTGKPKPTGDKPDESAADPGNKNQNPAQKNGQKDKKDKANPKPGDEKSGDEQTEGDMPPDKDGNSPETGDTESNGGKPSKQSADKPGGKPKDGADQKPSGDSPSGDSNSDPESESDSSTASETSDTAGDKKTKSADDNPGKSKAGQNSPAGSKPKDSKPAAGEKSGNKANSDDSDPGESQPGEEPADEGAKSKADADPAGEPKRKTGKSSDKAAKPESSAENDPGAKPNSKTKQKTDGAPNSSEDELKGAGDPKGQKSEKPDSGEGGGSKEEKQGNRGSKTPGPGENAEKPGDEMTAKEKTGRPDPEGQRGKGSTNKPGNEMKDAGTKEGEGGEKSGQKPGQKSGNKKSEQGGGDKSEAGGKSESQSDESGQGESGKPSNKPGKSSKAGQGAPGEKAGEASNPTQGDAKESGFAGAGGNAAAAETDPEAANLDYNRRAAELVLQRLKDDLNNDSVDPKLLEELGWTPEQLARFTERLAKQLEKPADELSPLDESRRQQFEEMLKTLDLKQGGTQRTGEKSPQREINQTGARRAPVPPDYKAAYEAFTKNLSKQKNSKAKPKR